ncbi:hypothetical protein Tco_1183809 [Tanacetum coccineum]
MDGNVDRPYAGVSRQKSYADRRSKPVGILISGDMVMYFASFDLGQVLEVLILKEGSLGIDLVLLEVGLIEKDMVWLFGLVRTTVKREKLKEIFFKPNVYSAAHCKNEGVIDWYQEPKIIMANVFPPNHVDDLPDPALAIPKPALVDENEELEKEEFKDEEEI